MGKVSRASASLTKLKELNPYVKVEEISDMEAAIKSKRFHVVCQTEIILNGKAINPENVNNMCRESKVGYISSQTFGPWGYAFVDFGNEHIVTDHDGEQTKSFIVTMIEKAKETRVTVHEDKRHIFQEGDYVVFREVEGMVEINETKPIRITSTTTFTFTLDLDSTGFSEYQRQGVVENVKVPKTVSFHSWEQSFKNPAASAQYGMMEPPDLAKFGRSEQLHAALLGITQFIETNQRFPDNTQDDYKSCLDLANSKMAALKEQDESNINVEIDTDVFQKAVVYASCSISPMAAFFGGIVAQEIVKYTGKYSPLKQWLHFDIYETLPKGEVNRAPLGSRYDDQIKIYGHEL